MVLTKENNMFEISEETKKAAIEKMKEIWSDVEVAEEVLEKKTEECFKAAVAIVKKQFGM
jgi:hypothetical protein